MYRETSEGGHVERPLLSRNVPKAEMWRVGYVGKGSSDQLADEKLGMEGMCLEVGQGVWH